MRETFSGAEGLGDTIYLPTDSDLIAAMQTKLEEVGKDSHLGLVLNTLLNGEAFNINEAVKYNPNSANELREAFAFVKEYLDRAKNETSENNSQEQILNTLRGIVKSYTPTKISYKDAEGKPVEALLTKVEPNGDIIVLVPLNGKLPKNGGEILGRNVTIKASDVVSIGD